MAGATSHGGEPFKPEKPNGAGRGASRAVRDRLIALGSEAELWHTPANEPWASVPMGGHFENHRIAPGGGFEAWLTFRFYEAGKSAPGGDALGDAMRVLRAMALFDGPEHDVFFRIGAQGGRIYLDLGDPDWRAVEVSAKGWCMIDQPPIKFRRTGAMAPLEEPEPGGAVSDLEPFLNVDQAGFRLIVAWLVAALRPEGPFPVLVLSGEHGSAKSWATYLLRQLIDPNEVALRSPTHDLRDFMVGVRHSWIVALDNLSSISATLSDTLCRVASGGGFSARALRTDDDEFVFRACRPICLNGISSLTTRPDLADRAIAVELDPIAMHARRPESELRSEFEVARPFILGALLDGVSAAIAGEAKVELDGLTRMADFEKWATAAEAGLPWDQGTISRLFRANRHEAVEGLVEDDTIANAIRNLAGEGRWVGTASELLESLRRRLPDEVTRANTFPQTPRGLGAAVMRVAPPLRAVGVEVRPPRKRAGKARSRIYEIRRIAEEAPAGEVPDQQPATDGGFE